MGEVAGNRGNFFRGAALGAAAGFVRDRGLGPRADSPARSPRTVAAFPSAQAWMKVGCRLPSLSPAKADSGIGMLPAPFCRPPQAPSPAGQWLCQAASPCLGGAGRRAGEGQTPLWSPAGGKRCEAAQLLYLRPALTLSLLRPLSALGLRAKWEKWRKGESFF